MEVEDNRSDKQPRGVWKHFASGECQPTILFSSHLHRRTLRARAHVSVCSHPHLILCPLLQALQHIAGGVRPDAGHLVPLRVLSSQGLVADCVAHNGAMAASSRRCHPTHLEAGGAQADQMYLLRGCRRGCRGRGAKPHEGGIQIKQKKKKLTRKTQMTETQANLRQNYGSFL